MDTHPEETERKRLAAAISVWENEGGAPAHESMHHQYGRRIEADRSWTIYHVFTGLPARFRGDAMTGLSRLSGCDQRHVASQSAQRRAPQGTH